MFTEEFRESLRLGKYSRWAVNLNEDQLEAILWMVGEFGYRAPYLLPLLTELWREEGSGRAVLALESLFRVVGGDRPNQEGFSQRVRDFLAEVRGYAEDTDGPPAHNWPVQWRGQLVGWVAFPELNDYGCSCSGAWWPGTRGTAEFLSVVGQPSPDGVRATVGGVPAFVKSPPDESGRVAFWLHVSPHNPDWRAEGNV